VADAHRLVVRKVNRQASGDLLWAPCPGPSSILPLATPASVPRHGGAGNGNAARSDDYAGQPLLHISAQGSREIVEADRPSRRPISCMEWLCTRRSAISSRSASDRYRPESGFAEDLNIAGGMPPAFRNHLVPRGCDTPASSAASLLLIPDAIANQNRLRSSRPATGGRPGDGNGARPDRSDRRFRVPIATSSSRVLRRPFESALFARRFVRLPSRRTIGPNPSTTHPRGLRAACAEPADTYEVGAAAYRLCSSSCRTHVARSFRHLL
jgi:hypothetical protein